LLYLAFASLGRTIARCRWRAALVDAGQRSLVRAARRSAAGRIALRAAVEEELQ